MKAVALVLMEYAMQNGRSCGIIRFYSKGSIQEYIFQNGKYSIELIEHNHFQNADIVFPTDGEYAVSEISCNNVAEYIILKL